MAMRVFLDQPLAEQDERIALRPAVDLLLRAIGADDRVALVVADGAVGLRLDQGRAVAGPRPFDRLLRHLVDGEHVVAVDGDAGNAVGRRLGGDVGVERDAMPTGVAVA